MTVEPRHDETAGGPAACAHPEGECPRARAWREVAEALVAACSFDEFGNLYEVHAGDLREAAERFHQAKRDQNPAA